VVLRENGAEPNPIHRQDFQETFRYKGKLRTALYA
jgi:hypothetical protein